jgi:hypothetical protein
MVMEGMRSGPSKYIDTVIEALYASFCGPAGQKRNWDELFALFIPGAQILRADVAEGGCSQATRMEVREFAGSIEAFIEQKGYFGLELLRRTEMSGSLAKVLSVYEGRFDPHDHLPFRKGTSEIRLYHDGERWWIVNMLLREYRDDDLVSRG